MTLNPYQERVIDEEIALKDKLRSLNSFINGIEFRQLPIKDQILLTEQYGYMMLYLTVLHKRIHGWEE
jgi:hypothetical protein